jgi:hypothetical protein
MQQQERTGQHTKKQHGFSRSNKPVHFTWPALLADQTGDGENFMRRYLQRANREHVSPMGSKNWDQSSKQKPVAAVRPASVQR